MRRDDVIYDWKTEEDVSRFFAEIVSDVYLKQLNIAQISAIDDRDEYMYWENRMLSEIPLVEESAYFKMCDILENTEKNKKYYQERRGIIFKRKVVSIVAHGGFYDDLLSDVSVQNFMPVNVEYVIDLKRRTLSKIVHPQGTEL